MTKEEREFIKMCILNFKLDGCSKCPMKNMCENLYDCGNVWDKYLLKQHPESADKKLTLKMLVNILQGFMDQGREIAYRIIDHTNIQREANLMGIAIKENEVSTVLIKLNHINDSIGINTKSIRDAIRDVTRDGLAKGFIDSIKEGDNV